MSKEKLDAYLKAKQADGKKLFIPYIVAGEDGFDALKDQILFLQECGVSAIELGIPFSDPVADGPTIQQAGLRALKRGISLGKVLDFLSDFPERNVPIILMTYLNPVYAYGIDQFAEKCAEVGVSGVIIPDIPMEEESIIAGSLKTHAIAFIRLVALTSTEDRMIELAKRSEGFLYAVSVTGTTGARAEHQDNVYAYLDKLKQHSHVPVLAGFGVSNAEQAQTLASHCDGVIVGSTIVDLLHQGKNEKIQQLIQESL